MEQKTFTYKFNQNLDVTNFFVNESNNHAFNGIINNNYNNSYLFGPIKSGKSFLGKIWLSKNNGKLIRRQKKYGDKNHKVIEKAPGRYVREVARKF